jgi:hypothetical protein
METPTDARQQEIQKSVLDKLTKDGEAGHA